MALNIKLDAMMKKLDITEKELLQAEDESDKRLEKVKKKMES